MSEAASLWVSSDKLGNRIHLLQHYHDYFQQETVENVNLFDLLENSFLQALQIVLSATFLWFLLTE